ncbi:hypothetical protein AHAS_Ahas12G0164300 [Arachis hypogaea]
MKLCRFTVFFPLDITVTAALSSFTLPLCLIDANSSPLPLSASVSLTVSDKLVVAFLRSPVLRAFPTLIVAGGSSSSSRDWTSSSLPVLSLKSLISSHPPPMAPRPDLPLKGICVWKAKHSSTGSSSTFMDSQPTKPENESKNLDIVGPGRSFRNFKFNTALILQAMETAFLLEGDQVLQDQSRDRLLLTPTTTSSGKACERG